MKDILFLLPLWYTVNGVRRFARYLKEERPGYTSDVAMPCSNAELAARARPEAERAGFRFGERPNYGGGEGSLWWLQNQSGIDLSRYRYLWYFEESCEPVRPGWMARLIGDMDAGAPLTGWWWNPRAKRRPGAIAHEVESGGQRMIYHENGPEAGVDPDGHPFDGMLDLPAYRHESIVFRMEDFRAFAYPDPRDPLWADRNGVRSYGVKAERFFWRPEEADRHGLSLPSPNLQWRVMMKHGFVPPEGNIYRSYFRELPLRLRTSERYTPKPLAVRNLRRLLAERGIAPRVRHALGVARSLLRR